MKLIELFNQNELNEQVYLFLKEWYNPSPVVTLNTSGSTGEAKKIVVEKAKMIISAQKTLNHFQISKKSKVLLCLSPNTIGGKMMIVRSIIGDLKLHIGKLNANPLSEISDIFDFCAMVPMQIINTLTDNPEKFKIIKQIIIGGATLPNDIEKELVLLNPNIFHTFGMTETLSHFAVRKVGIDDQNVYKTLKGVTVSSDNNKLVVNYPEILEMPLHTKEIVNILNFDKFEWIGRSDFTINSGGIKIIPENIENKICSFISKPFFISSLKDNYLGQKVIIVIESDEHLHLMKKDFKGDLETYEIPKEYFILKKFKRTISDKINRIETKKLLTGEGFKIL
jgi:O-succinylbenzoic acid--CoA ligase